jgi:hypothetical protein
MKPAPNPDVEPYRANTGRLASSAADGNNGVFIIPRGPVLLQIIASDGLGWDHVSVVPIDRRTKRRVYRTPTWAEMSFVKSLFFSDDECVVQYHPPKHLHRNAHEDCLHLWRPQAETVPLPDPAMVA